MKPFYERYRLAAAVPAAAGLLLLASCVPAGAPDSGEAARVTLTFWTTAPEQEHTFWQQRVAAFEREHPGIKVNLQQRQFPFATNEFKTAILGSQEVDVFRADNTWIPEYAELELLHPLNAVSPEAELAEFIPSALDSVTYKNEVYGLPTVMEVPALLYNKRLLREAGFSGPPGTMDELLRIAQAVTREGRYGLYVTEDSYFALPYVWAFGGGMVTDDRRVEIASADSQQAFEFMLKLRRSGVTQPYPDFTDWYSRMMQDFAVDGRAAMIINGPWAVHEILQGKEFLGGSNLGIASIPKGPKGQGSPVGGHSLVINKYSGHLQESQELIRYLTSSETQVLQSGEFKTLPTRSAVYEDPRLAGEVILQGFKQQLDAGRARPMIPEGARLFMDFTPNLNAMLLEKQSVQEGVRRIEASWKRLLKLP